MTTAHLPRPSIAIGRNGIIAIVGALGILSVASKFAQSQLDWIDNRIADPFSSPHLVGFFRNVSELGSTEVTVALGIAGSVALWRRCRPLAILYPTAIAGGLLVNVILKAAIGRARPPDALTSTSLASFPSGHTIQATIALGMLPPVLYALTGRRAVGIAATVLAAVGIAAVGISRVALGAHWASDIVGGILVGVLVLLAAEFALDRMPARWVRACTDCPLHRSLGLAHNARAPAQG